MPNNKDAVLGALGKKILSTPFRRTLDLSMSELSALRDAHARNQHKNVLVLNNNANLIAFYCGGSKRCIATVSADYITACRIADMAIHLFGKWRLQKPRELRSTDYNFSAAQAQADLDNEPELFVLLKQVENHLRSIGALLNPENPSAVPAAMKNRVGNSTLTEALKRIGALEAQVKALEARL